MRGTVKAVGMVLAVAGLATLTGPASATFNKPELAFASNSRVMQLVVKFIF